MLGQLFTEAERLGRKKRLCSIANPCGPENVNWVCGRSFDTGSGYWQVRKPSWFTGYVKSKQVEEHIVVYCEANGLTEIPEGYVVHHIDLDKLNNDLSNLVLMTNSEHIKLHRRLRREVKFNANS